MASLFSTAIVAFCASNATGQYNEACNKALDAATRQTGWRQKADIVEDRTVQFVSTKVTTYTPRPVQEAAGIAGFLYKTVQSKSLHFRIPTLGLADSASNDITPTSYAVTVTWRMP